MKHDPTKTLLILKTTDPDAIATKKLLEKNGERSSKGYNMGKEFIPSVRQVLNIRSLYDKLLKIQDDRRSVIVRSVLGKDVNPKYPITKKAKYLREEPLRWLCVDVDTVPLSLLGFEDRKLVELTRRQIAKAVNNWGQSKINTFGQQVLICPWLYV